MDSRPARDLGALIGATAVTRCLFRSHRLYDIDSVNFALALQRFDPQAHQPHPPGYFLYVYLGRLANWILQDANTALVAISILASCGAVAMIYVLACTWFGRLAARFAGLIFFFSPLAWFHGTVALTYIVEAFFSALLANLCWRAAGGSKAIVLSAAVVLGVAAGLRPSSLLILGPLLVFSLRRLPRRTALMGLAALSLTLLAWLIPMLRQSGGLAGYLGPLWSLWRLVPSRATVFNSSPLTSLARFCTIVGIYGLCFGTASLLTFARPHSSVDRRITQFTWVWIAPSLVLFTFVFLKFVNSGYLLVVMPAACVWLGYGAANWYTGSAMAKSAKFTLLGLAAAANTVIFLYAPLYCSYRETSQFEAELNRILITLPQVAAPQDTLIVGFDSHFLGYRHAGYYLPDYLVVQFPEVPLASGTGVFWMQHRDTRVTAKIPMRPYKYFILFPLPSSEREYHGYLDGVRARLPPGELRVVARGGFQYTVGPAADLGLLFPSAAR
ncbi:MAG TPA: DUF2723 domain-containing protein [Bryobacteraceae bacterium]|nr:DUF2723 domain-containing protein [Bryobacteraceae bacterium]